MMHPTTHLLLQAPPPSDYSTPFEAKGEINDSFSYVPSVSGDWNDEENEASFTIEYLEEKPRLLRPKNESSSENAEKYMELDPNESILASSGDPNDFGIPPLLTNYSPMFQELTRKLMEEERVKSRVLSFDERIKRLKEELTVVKEEKEKEKREEQSTSSWSSRPSILKKGSIRRPIRRKSALSIHTVEYDTELIDMNEMTCEMMENMSEDELKHVCNSLFESSPRVRFRGFYPFLVEGMIQKDYQTKDLKLFSSRLRNVRIPDTREPNQMSTDYVYFVVVRQGVFGGFWYETHPNCLISAKFRSQHETVLHGYAILAYPIGSKEDSMNEERWICWNDSLGMMSINKRSAMIAMKKQPGWDKQLDIVTFSANSYNGRYVVDKIVALTNSKDKRIRIPVEIFLIVDATFLESRRDDIVFYSDVLKSEILIKKDRIGNVNEALPYEVRRPGFEECAQLFD
ncbi:hypothetical protein CRE_30527 [Caenorhabditis remanei]|uniref:Uncharacterized protein n=1 Tax=Caenorhabditis remanei TaxID=31234 RepID=E3NK25_CAERE|nr:hypothetical protein CRE_30527 [Caenorhabditis remanei]